MVDMRVLITGAAGFIGSNLYARCVQEGWDVTGVDDLSNGHLDFLPEKHDCYVCSFDHEAVIERVRDRDFDVVFHLAAVPRVSYSVEHPLETHDANVTRTLNLVQACVGNVRRFVFASSSSVYGGADLRPTPESYPKDPKSPYALQKSIVEDYLVMYGHLYGLDSACLRFFNVFGPNQLGDSPYATAVSAWLDAIKRGRPMRSDGDGTQSRDMCYVDNVTDACVKVAKADWTMAGQCYNVACGDRTTNREILEHLLKRYPGSSYVNAPWRAGDVMHTLASVDKACRAFGYTPVVRFWEGLDRTIKWYDDNWDRIKDLRLKT